jgi:hypothetical protein
MCLRAHQSKLQLEQVNYILFEGEQHPVTVKYVQATVEDVFRLHFLDDAVNEFIAKIPDMKRFHLYHIECLFDTKHTDQVIMMIMIDMCLNEVLVDDNPGRLTPERLEQHPLIAKYHKKLKPY